jgi:hypothetical protein
MQYKENQDPFVAPQPGTAEPAKLPRHGSTEYELKLSALLDVLRDADAKWEQREQEFQADLSAMEHRHTSLQGQLAQV